MLLNLKIKLGSYRLIFEHRVVNLEKVVHNGRGGYLRQNLPPSGALTFSEAHSPGLCQEN